MKKLAKIFVGLVFLALLAPAGHGKSPVRSKFYDFNDQIVNGEIKKPATLYTDARERVKFDRLLRLKKSFIDKLLSTAKEKVFK